jgi:hypothetical protein
MNNMQRVNNKDRHTAKSNNIKNMMKKMMVFQVSTKLPSHLDVCFSEKTFFDVRFYFLQLISLDVTSIFRLMNILPQF